MFSKRQKRLLKKVKAYKELFNTDRGIEVLHDLAESCHVNSTAFDENPYEMARKEGAREVILAIMRLADTDLFKLERQFKEMKEFDSDKDEFYA